MQELIPVSVKILIPICRRKGHDDFGYKHSISKTVFRVPENAEIKASKL